MASSVQAAEDSFPLASTTAAILLIVAVAVATRIVAWWNPVAHVDDQFYLLAGEELLRGHWPYVDVWDRKPLGLFLLYSGIAWIGGGSILGLNLVATTFAAATAVVIRQIALRFASATSATLAALTYLLTLPAFSGQTGQSPVFYNLLIAGAAWLMFRASDQESAATIRRHAYAAMLLCGLSMTIKQVSFVEGAYFGLAFLWLVKRSGSAWPAMVVTGAAMIVLALLPYGLTMAGYALAGEVALREFIYANFVSIFQRQSFSILARLAGAAFLILYLFPLIAFAVIGMITGWRATGAHLATRLLLGWLVAALLGYLMVPAFFDHYALPLVSPLSIAAAIFFDRGSGRLFFAANVAFNLIGGYVLDWKSNQAEAARYELIRQTVDRARRGGCVYVADGPSRLYSDFPDCRPTKYLFPDHLVLITESNAVGVDTVDEVAWILAQKPEVIVTRMTRKGRHSAAIQLLLTSRLKNYRPVLTLPPDPNPTIGSVKVWQRSDLAAP